MSECVFIQFYSNWKKYGVYSHFFNGEKYVNLNSKNSNSTVLFNGFSSMYYSCLEMGDFHWVNYDFSSTFKDTIELNKNTRLPINRGKAYISAFFNVHLYQTYLWACEYPNVEFIVGGPAVDINKVSESLPENLLLTPSSIDKVIDGKPSWGISFPDGISDIVSLGVPIDRHCYWGKCKFCNYDVPEKNQKIDYDCLKNLPKRKKQILFLSTPSASPDFLRNTFTQMPIRSDFEYFFLIRADLFVIPILKESLNINQERKMDLAKVNMAVGFEFPANRILKWLNKGTSLNSYLKFIETIFDYKCQLTLAFILGFDNLTRHDVDEAKNTLLKLYEITAGKVRVRIHNLACKKDTPIYHELKKGSDISLGPFYLGYLPDLTKEQQALNDEVRDYIYALGFLYIEDFYSCNEIKNRPFL